MTTNKPKDIKQIQWPEYIQLIYDLGEYIDRQTSMKSFAGIYGIPRGGLIIATVLSHKHSLPLIVDHKLVDKDSKILIVDDISDTGTCLKPWKDKGFIVATIHINPTETIVIPDFFLRTNEDMWIRYPYEQEHDTTPQYLR